MAKVLGLINPNVNGKLGNTVFYVRKAQTLARAYQPSVSNPKSTLQVIQRDRMKVAVDLNNKFRANTQKMYGTGTGKFEFQGVQKIIMNSMAVKQKGAAKLTTTGKAAAIVYNDLNLKNVMDAIANSYRREGINIFDPGETVMITTQENTGVVQNAYALHLIDNSFQSITNKGNLYFGCDYRLGDSLMVNGVGVVKSASPASANATMYSKTIEIAPAEMTESTTFSGTRRRGFFTELANCGDSWKYYYIISNITTDPIMGVSCPCNGIFTEGNGTALIGNLAFVIAVANTDILDGVQVVAGYSYNTVETVDESVDVAQSYTITATASPTAGGTITGGGSYVSGTTVTLTATANSGYTFSRWSDGVTTASRQITVTGNATYTAVFTESAGSMDE